MSIFDGDGEMDPLPWLQEKTLVALEEAARLVDLANEPDTTVWYARTLKERASAIVGRLAPVVALVYQAGQEAANPDSWTPILEGGSFALAGWCKRFGIRDPRELAVGAIAKERDDAERDEKGIEAKQEVIDAADLRGAEHKLSVFSGVVLRLMADDLPPPARRMLLWFLFNLRYSEWADVVLASRRFLPTDIGCTAEEAAAAYRTLYEQEWISRVDELSREGGDRLALALVVRGLSDRKHPPPFREEKLGYKGATLGGVRTRPEVYFLEIPKAVASLLAAWGLSAGEIAALKEKLQNELGEDRVMIEEIRVEQSDNGVRLEVKARVRRDDEGSDLEAEFGRHATGWLRKRFFKESDESSEQ